MDNKIHTWVIGDPGTWDEYNPLKVTQQKVASKILYFLNKNPLSESELFEKTEVDREDFYRTVRALLKNRSHQV